MALRASTSADDARSGHVRIARAQDLMQSIIVSARDIIGDIGPVARHDAQKARALKVLYRQVYRRLVYPCALGKLALARQLLAGAQLAREYLRLYALEKALLRLRVTLIFSNAIYRYRLCRMVID